MTAPTLVSVCETREPLQSLLGQRQALLILELNDQPLIISQDGVAQGMTEEEGAAAVDGIRLPLQSEDKGSLRRQGTRGIALDAGHSSSGKGLLMQDLARCATEADTFWIWRRTSAFSLCSRPAPLASRCLSVTASTSLLKSQVDSKTARVAPAKCLQSRKELAVPSQESSSDSRHNPNSRLLLLPTTCPLRYCVSRPLLLLQRSSGCSVDWRRSDRGS